MTRLIEARGHLLRIADPSKVIDVPRAGLCKTPAPRPCANRLRGDGVVAAGLHIHTRFNMKKLILGAASAALALGLVTATTAASAKDRYPAWVEAADLNKDGMVSKNEFMEVMGKMYDDKMAKMKTMNPADQAKMIKNDFMTREAFRILYRDISGGGN
jgi:hypothetical protein